MAEIFDFGFTAVNEDELEVTQTMHTMANEAKGAQQKLDELYNEIDKLKKQNKKLATENKKLKAKKN